MRLRKMLEGGCSYAAISKDCTYKKKSGATRDATDINEVKVLQQVKLELEQQLKGKKFGRVEKFLQYLLST